MLARCLVRQRIGIGRDPQRQQQRRGRRLLTEGQLIARDLQRHPGGRQDPAEQGHGPRAGPDQDRHVGPGGAVLQVLSAEQVGDRLGLSPDGGVRVHLDRAGVARARNQLAQVAQRGLEADALSDRAARREQGGTRPTAGLQGHDGSGIACCRGEPVGEVEDALDLSAAEGVDRLVGIADDDEVPT